MLRLLRIKNLAVIDDLAWELAPGLNVLTGETGAGKSILIDAFYLLLGERADKTLIRDGAEMCSVEAELANQPFLKSFLTERDVEWNEDGLILKRSFTAQGQNRQSINGSPVTLQTLKALGDLLVDMHGPHDHQSLLSNDSQLDALDAFANTSELLQSYRDAFRKRAAVFSQIEQLNRTTSGDWRKHLDFLKHQIDEIEKAQLQEKEDVVLEKEFKLATHQVRILEISQSIRNLISDGEPNISQQLAQIERLLQEWERMDEQSAELRALNNGAITHLQELLSAVEAASENASIDEERLREIENRLNLIQTLKRKYGQTIEEVLQQLAALQNEFDDLSKQDEKRAAWDAEIKSLEKELHQLAEKLHTQRSTQAQRLAKAIADQLADLGFRQSDFRVEVKSLPDLNSHGKNTVEFMFSPNPGESARPLKSIASSGEMARVMLAIKTVMAAQDHVPILIFDEVDANVGGETAVTVGQKLKELGSSHQVLCITHLPQVAAAGQSHFRVEKNVKQGRSFTNVRFLEHQERVSELSRMLGGENASSEALAVSLLEGKAKKKK